MSSAKRTALSREIFAAAALRCFERYGPHRTSMADIAEEAGASRQSIYRFFSDRSELVQHILDERMMILARGLAEEFRHFRSFEEALVEGSLLSISAAISDPTMSAIIKHATDESVEHFLISGSERIQQEMDLYWGPWLDRARKEGTLRASATNEKIMEWIRHIHFVLMRDELSDTARREMLSAFFVPSLVLDAAAEMPAMTRRRALGPPNPERKVRAKRGQSV